MLLGTTYSHRFAKYLQLDPIQSFNAIIALNFNIIRLCCYWDEIQQSKDSFDYSAIKTLLDICEKQNQSVVVTVGMKGPRWPEFYIPRWVKSDDPNDAFLHTPAFIKETVERLKKYSCIKYWQVENEPLDPSGPNNVSISEEILKEEVATIKKSDDRPIVITTWGNELSKRRHISAITKIADIVGIDLYYKQYITSIFGKKIYKGPTDSDRSLKKIVESSSKPIWITELQAEPWESNMDQYKSEMCESMNIGILQSNLKKAQMLSPQAVLLWGIEYWLWKKRF